MLALLGLVPMANLVTDGPGLSWWGTAVREWAVGSIAIALVALALARFLPRQVELLERASERLILALSPRGFSAVVGLATIGLALFFGWHLFKSLPVSGDEFSQLWQAHLLNAGRLFVRSAAHREFFATSETLDRAGRSFSQFPIGGPAILSLGLAAGAPWIVNPILSGIAVVALYRFAARTTDELTARATSIVLALSPFFLFMGGTEMNHTASLACATLALAALATWNASDGGARATRAAALLGTVVGIAATIRPLDAAILGAAIGIFQLHAIARRPELRRSLLVQCLVGTIPLIALLAANRATVGSALTFAYDALNGPEHRPGFHRTPLGFDHTPRRGLYMISAYLMKLDAGMMGWAVPIVLLVVGSLALQRSGTRWDLLLLGILAAMLVGYSAYWGESYFLGPRYLFTALPIFALYIARFPIVLRERLRPGVLRSASSLLLPLFVATAWLMPPKDGRISGVWSLASVYGTKGSAAGALHADARRNLPDRGLVFIDDGWHARLTARLRATGMRPLLAEQVVSSMDACTIQRALDIAERTASDTSVIAAQAMALVARDAQAAPVPGLSKAEQLAFVPGRALPEECQRELRRSSGGVSFAEMLPFEPISVDGSIDGPIVYARDFGPRNELLRARFGDRPWFHARRRQFEGRTEFRFVPYQPPAP
ncbi:MAG: hypothetical protein ABI601_18130 [bacterium]